MNTSETMKHARAALGKSAADVAVDGAVEKLGNALAGHTPGPWQYDAGDKLNPDRAFGIVSSDDCDEGCTQVVAEVCDSGDYGRAEADARLIAAAPELLAACREAIRQIDYLRRRLSDKERRFTAPTTNATEEKLLSAIARAEGGAA